MTAPVSRQPRFPIERIDSREDGGAVRAYRITCTCGASCFYALKRGVQRRPPESISQHFRGYGWQVGTTERKDRCPECLKRLAQPSEETKTMTTPANGAAATSAAPKADPPREMTFTERRIILTQLGEVYGSAAYLPGWTDKRVATELKYPPAWVRQLREENFGPEGSNPTLDEFLQAQAAFAADRNSAQAMAVKHFEKGKELRQLLDALDGKARAMADLAKRVEKEIGR
jgi:hypothetical protein